MLKRMDIEHFIAWAYREELPKAVGEEPWAKIGYMRSGWASISAYGNLMSVVDVNPYGVVPLDDSDVAPHPDALNLHHAVLALEEFDLDLPDDWCPMPELKDMGDLGRNAVAKAIDSLTSIDETGHRRLRRGPAALIRRHALLGLEPEWRGQIPAMRAAKGANGGPLWFRRHSMQSLDAFGQPVEWTYEQPDGWDVARKRPKRGAYQKNELYPDPHPALVGRAEYEIWHAALNWLADELSGVLTEHEALPTARSSQPWDGVEAAAPRVFVAKRPVVA